MSSGNDNELLCQMYQAVFLLNSSGDMAVVRGIEPWTSSQKILALFLEVGPDSLTQ